MLTIGQVAKRYSLSRSSLIYYDKKGLLSPSGRSNSNYRMYSKTDIEKLERILLFRNAGVSLSSISDMIDKDIDEVEDALEKRLFTINGEIQALRDQQRVIIDIIGSKGSIENTRIVTKEKWVEMLRAAGLDEDGMWNWHIEFERSSPEGHQDFLESIGISSEEICSIREKSRMST
jgi:DNA-binding transcriptional MerR regulator